MTTDKRHHVVALDGHVQLPPLSIPHTITSYTSTSASELADRIKDATIIVCSATKLPHATLVSSASPGLALITSMGAGHDHVSHDAVRELGVTLCNVPAQNTDSVTEHAIALYFAVKRRLLPMHAYTVDGESWGRTKVPVRSFGQVPRTCGEEVLGVVGYGALGKLSFFRRSWA